MNTKQEKNKNIISIFGFIFVCLAGFATVIFLGELFAPRENSRVEAEAENQRGRGGFGSFLQTDSSLLPEAQADYIPETEEDAESNGTENTKEVAKETNGRQFIEPDEEVKKALLIGDRDVIDKALLHQYKRINSETVGIIRINGTVLNHPLMQSPNQENFYLNHDVFKQKNGNGTPFLVLDADLSKNGENCIIYGHNIRYGRKDIFEPLSGYERLSFYKEHPTVEIVTEEGTVSYLVFAYYLIDTSDEDTFVYWMSPSWEEEAEFTEYMSEVEKRNWLDTGIPCEFYDKYITLSACSVELAHSGTNRMVVMARRIRDGEYPVLYAKNAVMKANPILPRKLRND